MKEKMKQLLEREPLWTKSFTLLVIANLFVFMSFQMLIPIIPPHIKSLGATGLEVGLVTTLFSFGAILIRPFIGYLLAFKDRKPLVLIGAISLLIITVLYPFTQILFIFLLFRLLHGIGWGWSTTVNGTAAVDVVPNARLGEGMGYFGLSITIGMIIAPSFGIYLYQQYDFNILIMISAIFSLIAIILLSIIRYKTPSETVKTKQDKLEFSIIDSLVEKSSWYPAFVTLMATFGYGTIVTFIVIFSEERALDKIFLFYLVNAFVATIVRPVTGRWFDRRGPKWLVIFCAFLSFIGIWVLSFATENIHIVASAILFGAGYGSLLPALQSWVLAKTDPAKRGVANGMFYSAIDLGIGLSGLVFGIIAHFLAISQLFQISSIFFILVIIFTLFASEETLEKRQPKKVISA